MSSKKIKYQLRGRIWIDIGKKIFIGEGRASLLKKTAELGSIRKALAEPGISYRQAWYSLNQMNKATEIPVISLQRGGKNGGITKTLISYLQSTINMNKILAAVVLTLTGLEAIAQQEADTTSILQKTCTLGEVNVSAMVDKVTVDAVSMQKYNAKYVSTALRTLPSLILSENGARNESTVYLRGFDIRSVPVYMDGIPVYVPYDGNLDLARFTTYVISRIDVAKGFSSMTYM